MTATFVVSKKCCNNPLFIFTAFIDNSVSDLNNTISVADPTFGLLANNQAVAGMGTVMDPDCLQVNI